jgi:DNA-binding MarR family transcriptional regulator
MNGGSRSTAVDRIEAAMVAIRRSQSRRAITRVLQRLAGPTAEVGHSMVVDALDRSADDIPPPVGAVAERLGIDPSRASRMVASAVKAGFVRRVASQEDGRRVGLELTDQGKALAELARTARRQVFGQAVANWTDDDAEAFARLLARFVDDLDRLGVAGG